MIDFSSVRNISFIGDCDDLFDISNYKLLVVFSSTLVDGENVDGKCLFIPYMQSEKDKGSTIDEYYYHKLYLANALVGHDFSSYDKAIKEAIDLTLHQDDVSSEKIISILIKNKNIVLYDISHNGIKNMLLFLPEDISLKQNLTLKKIITSLKEHDYIVNIDYVSKDIDRVKRLTFTQ